MTTTITTQVIKSGGVTIIPYDVTRDKIFRVALGIENPQANINVIERLTELFPEYFDRRVQAISPDDRPFGPGLYYKLNLKRGVAKGRFEVYNDLSDLFKPRDQFFRAEWFDEDGRWMNETGREMRTALNGERGIVIGVNYGLKKRGGVQFEARRDTLLEWPGEGYQEAFYHLINSLFLGIDLSTEELKEQKYASYPLILNTSGEVEEYHAILRDPSLKSLRAADKPVGEFMSWMQEHREAIQELGSLAKVIGYLLSVSDSYKVRVDAEELSLDPGQIEEIAQREFAELRRRFGDLRPLQNNRMDYVLCPV